MKKQLYAPRPEINVTDDHYDRGIKKSSTHCAVQMAIEEQLPWAQRILVDLQTIRCSDPKKGLRYTWLTPSSVMAAIIAWDYGVRPKPFTFRLRAAQITSMRVRQGERGGCRYAVHKLGRKRVVITPGDEKKRMRPTVIGGRPPPTNAAGSRRVYGKRAFGINGKHPFDILLEDGKVTLTH